MRNLGTKFLLTSLLILCAVRSGASAQSRWIASWATSPQEDAGENVLTSEELRASTLRQIVHLSLGGKKIRLHLSNRYGTEPLHLLSVHVAKAVAPGSAKIIPSTDKAFEF